VLKFQALFLLVAVSTTIIASDLPSVRAWQLEHGPSWVVLIVLLSSCHFSYVTIMLFGKFIDSKHDQTK
jgi:hypothetical protein